VLDRESTLADPAIVKMLKSDFIPVAFDQWYLRKQNDAEGKFYRKIANQGPRHDFDSTTQGFYITDAAGKLHAFNNNRGPKRIRNLLQQTLQEFDPPKTSAINDGEKDPKYSRKLPADAVVVRVNGKVLGGYDDPKNEWESVFQSAISRDNFWLLAAEQKALTEGIIPDSMIKRIARFHLVDGTRGEPSMWIERDIRKIKTELLPDGTILGNFHLETKHSDRGFVGQIRGRVEIAENKKVKTFNLVASGQYWGEGRYTRNGPNGKFPFAVAFRLADGTDVADSLPPQGTKGWLEGYYR
jgi:hypothetical protein